MPRVSATDGKLMPPRASGRTLTGPTNRGGEQVIRSGREVVVTHWAFVGLPSGPGEVPVRFRETGLGAGIPSIVFFVWARVGAGRVCSILRWADKAPRCCGGLPTIYRLPPVSPKLPIPFLCFLDGQKEIRPTPPPPPRAYGEAPWDLALRFAVAGD